MSYEEFIAWMFNLERFGIKLGLENISEFLERIGNPQRDFRSVHVTGTNGKGSVCVFASEILRMHGLKVGLYTSPHLVDFRERIVLDGEMMPQRDVLRIGTELKEVHDAMIREDPEKQLTFFEFTTGMAFKFFSQRKAEIVVAEVGMGGRLDATNVLMPEAAAITRIGLEHTNYLGKTIPEIAREKAGIIKDGASVVTCERNPDSLAVLRSTCKKKSATLRAIDADFRVTKVRQTVRGTSFDYAGIRTLNSLRTHLLGGYQAENAAGAIAIMEELSRKGVMVSDDDIRKGLLRAKWPGRLDIVSRKPLLIFDGSHNPDGVTTTVRILDDLGLTPLTYVLGCMDDKDAVQIVRALGASAAKVVVTQAKYKRALPAEKLSSVVEKNLEVESETVALSEEAFAGALEDHLGKGVCVIGSLYLVGEAIQWWRSRGTKAATRKI